MPTQQAPQQAVLAEKQQGTLQLTAQTTRLVYGLVSGFGQSGPASVRPGFDIAAQAESGMMSLNGPPDGEPTRVGFTAVDVMAAHALTTGVLAALLRRSLTGRGGLVNVSLIDVAVEALTNAWAEYRLTGVMPLRCGNGQPTAAPAANVIQTADGMVVVSAYTEDHFPRLCTALGRSDMAVAPGFRENQSQVQNPRGPARRTGPVHGSSLVGSRLRVAGTGRCGRRRGTHHGRGVAGTGGRVGRSVRSSVRSRTQSSADSRHTPEDRRGRAPRRQAARDRRAHR